MKILLFLKGTYEYGRNILFREVSGSKKKQCSFELEFDHFGVTVIVSTTQIFVQKRHFGISINKVHIF